MARNAIEIIIKTIGAKKASSDLKSVGSATDNLSVALGGLLKGGLLAGAGLAIFQYGASAEASAEKIDRLGVATDAMAKRIGETQSSMLDAIQKASGHTVDQFTALKAANKAMIFGLIDSADQMGELTTMARVLGNAMGQDTAKSIDDLTTALGRQTPLILDNLGLISDVTGWQEQYAEQLGKTVDQLTEAEKKQSFVNGALAIGREKVAELGGITVTTADASDHLSAVWSDLTDTVGSGLTPAISAAKEALAGFLEGVDAAVSKNSNLDTQYAYLNRQLQEITKNGEKSLTERGKADVAEIRRLMHVINAEREAAKWVDHQDRAIRDATVAIERQSTEAKKQAEWQKTLSDIAHSRAQAELYILQTMQDEDASAFALSNTFKNTMADIKSSQVDAATASVTAWQGASNDLQTLVSSQIQPTLSDVWQPPQQDQHIDEWARRAATLATDGLSSEWLPALQSQFGGTDFWQPVADAVASGDDSAVKKAMTDLLAGGGDPQLFDTELIKQRVRDAISQQNVRQELIDTITAELQGEGLNVSTGDVAAQIGGGGVAAGIAGELSGGLPDAIKNNGTGSALMAAITAQIKDNKKAALDLATAVVKGMNEHLQDVIGEFKLISALTDNVIEQLGLVEARP